MNEQLFIQTLNKKAGEIGINPLLLISGIEGLYTFKDVQLSEVNYNFLDSLILTILALRIGDQFHTLAEENLASKHRGVMQAAALELQAISNEEIARTSNSYLQSFAKIMGGKSVIRNYHVKALEVAALEVKKAQVIFNSTSISAIIMFLCEKELSQVVDLGALFA